MEWAKAISTAIGYIEENITKDLTAENIARQVNISSFYFQKGFGMLCGFTITEYIRSRRLALAAEELSGGAAVIDTAVKYGYDSPDSFAKAFYRFHGVTPSMARKNLKMLKTFAPLKIKLSLEGGYTMDYRIVKKESFTVLGAAKNFTYESAAAEIPKFWAEHAKNGGSKFVHGMFGVNIDEKMGSGNDSFEYLIADVYNPAADIPDGFTTRVIPAYTWAVFPIKGALPDAMRDVNKKIFSEWLPALRDYEFAAGCCIEMYDLPDKYPNGTGDANYYTEIWIPVKKK